MDEVRVVCDFLEGKRSAAEILEKFAPHATSPEFDPERDLKRIGVANQTTMLANESLAIAAETRAAMARGNGEEYAAANFRTFDTICSATQDRQDAVKELLLDPPDIMLVVGGYNSSNTISLTALCADKVRTYHIEDAACLDVENDVIHHRVRQGHDDVTTPDWLPAEGDVVVGITAGASTPNNKIAETVARVFATRGVDPATIV
jgi:4-hydroxy-3-methylbut-2-enyl diphosphate reductase